MATPPTNQQLLRITTIASTNLSFQIPSLSIKLDRANYPLWRTTIIYALECFELESFVLAPFPPTKTIPAPPTDDETTIAGASHPNLDYIPWEKKDGFVLLWLKSTLTECSLAYVARSTSTNQAWLILERTFQAQTRDQRMQLTKILQTIIKGASSMIDYLDQKR